jgi:amino acid transporter
MVRDTADMRSSKQRDCGSTEHRDRVRERHQPAEHHLEDQRRAKERRVADPRAAGREDQRQGAQQNEDAGAERQVVHRLGWQDLGELPGKHHAGDHEGLIRYGRVTERAPEARDDDIAQEPLPRQLGFWSIWLLAVNGILGSGIFGLPGTATRLAGEWAQLLYLGCALLVLPVLLCFGELASRFRSTGGPATYATEAFGPFVGFQAGWLFYVARVVSVSAGSVLLVDSLAYFWPAANVGPTRVALIAAVIFGFVLITTIGSGQAIRALGSLTVLKFGVLLGLVAAGAPAALGGLATPPATTPETLDLGRATVLLIFAYVGFESAVVPGGEARRPERDMAWALLLSLGLVGLLYLAVQWVSRSVLPDLASSSTPLLDVAAVLLGPTGALLLMAGVACSLLGSLAGATFSTPRITYAFALDGRLPAWFGRVHPTFRTPANSIVVYGGLAFLLAVGGTFAGLAVASVFMRLLMYIVVCACVPVLRRASRAASPFAVPGGVLVPVLGVLTSGWLLQQVDLEAVLLTIALVAAGGALYLAARRQHAGPRAEPPGFCGPEERRRG